MRAAQSESTALSKPHGATMPQVRTFESRNSRSGPASLTTVADAGTLTLDELRIMLGDYTLSGFREGG